MNHRNNKNNDYEEDIFFSRIFNLILFKDDVIALIYPHQL